MRCARRRFGLVLQDARRYWSQDGRVEIDLVAGWDDGGLLFGECKWSEGQPVGTDVYVALRAKVAGLPDAGWRTDPAFVLFSLGGFTEELRALAANPDNRLYLVGGRDLLP